MLRFLSAGESHGPSLVAILEGIPAGLPITPDVINRELGRRQTGYGSGARMRVEKDTVQILGGVMAGETTGAPIALWVQNADYSRWKSKAIRPMTIPRPGHADLAGALKYGYRDLRPALERASARETAVRVAAGAVCKHFLNQFGIKVGGYVLSIGNVQADPAGMSCEERFLRAEESEVRCPVRTAAEAMKKEIDKIMRAGDTLGGILEVAAWNLPAGLGSYSQWDQRLEARLAMAVMSIPAIKGVEVGQAFENTRLPGTRAHDPLILDASQTQLQRPTNHAGGIEGGISNGQPILLRAAMKPIATTLTPQKSVDLAAGSEASTHYERSDFCPVPRAVPILEAMVALVLAGALIEKLGGDSLGEMRPRFESLRRAALEHLPMDNIGHIFWGQA